MSTPWLTVVGMGEDGLDGLSHTARLAVESAEVLIGSERLLAHVPHGSSERKAWPTPFDAAAAIAPHRKRRVVVLATGDPLHYGAGRSILAHYPIEDVRILPHVSAFSLAAARLGWPLCEVETVSLHGRSAALIEPLISPGARILALTEGAPTVREVARRLGRRGYGDSRVTALEHMGGPGERVTAFPARTIPRMRLSGLLTLAVECAAGPDAILIPTITGLPDTAFRHDGQITKREVRAITLAALAPQPGELLWDIGAGCGSVSIEWMRAARGARAIAFEREARRIRFIARNADTLGTPGLETVHGEAPGCLPAEPFPDAVFLGGAVAELAVFEAAWVRLKAGGRFVANAVTLEAEAHLAALHASHGGELVRIDISHAEGLGPLRAMRPRLPVTQWRAVKP